MGLCMPFFIFFCFPREHTFITCLVHAIGFREIKNIFRNLNKTSFGTALLFFKIAFFNLKAHYLFYNALYQKIARP